MTPAAALAGPPQLPIAEIDHLLTYVRDLATAGDAFARLGFTLTPPRRIEAMGITNRLVLMQPATEGAANFIELMTAHDRARLPPAMAETLSGEERIKSMVLMTPDAHAAQAAMVADGLAAAAPIHVRREWALSETESVYPEFDVILPVPDVPLAFNACRYVNIEPYRRPEWLEHPNGARRLATVYAVADEPAACAAFFERLFRTGSERREEGHAFAIAPGAVALVILSPAAARARFGRLPMLSGSGASYIGYGVEVEALDPVGALLARNGVPFADRGGRLVVPAEAACGNMIEFSSPAR